MPDPVLPPLSPSMGVRLTRLSPAQRDVVFALTIGGSYKSAARQLNMPMGTLQAHLAKALARLELSGWTFRIEMARWMGRQEAIAEMAVALPSAPEQWRPMPGPWVGVDRPDESSAVAHALG